MNNIRDWQGILYNTIFKYKINKKYRISQLQTWKWGNEPYKITHLQHSFINQPKMSILPTFPDPDWCIRSIDSLYPYQFKYYLQKSIKFGPCFVTDFFMHRNQENKSLTNKKERTNTTAEKASYHWKIILNILFSPSKIKINKIIHNSKSWEDTFFWWIQTIKNSPYYQPESN